MRDQILAVLIAPVGVGPLRGARHSDEDAAAQLDDPIADQHERVRISPERDHRCTAGEVPDHVGEHGPVQRLQLVKERVDQEKLRLVHARDREPGLPGYERRSRADRDVGPGHQAKPVEDRGDQQMPVGARLSGFPGSTVDDRPDPGGGQRPRRVARDSRLAADGGSARPRAHVIAEYVQTSVIRSHPAGQQPDQSVGGRRPRRRDSERSAAEARLVKPEASRPERPAAVGSDADTRAQHRGNSRRGVTGLHIAP